MYLLDTDHLSLIQRGSSLGQTLLTRLIATNQPFATTIVTYEEQSRGWLAYLSNAKTSDAQVIAYGFLQNHTLHYREIDLLPFSTAAAQIHQNLRQSYLRLGNNDLKIAAITIAHQATLLTRNTKDFGQIQTLTLEDWTI
ncbi:type II toxin-antitoxin system VapC family toxin [Alkalinema pantanalense CENA528]|uniref:type II toxin-antitoxin system VapC family toxin n=1 Tax=Alkalinema pantanalense TaxID=1620705 RepID=UPI003D6F022B